MVEEEEEKEKEKNVDSFQQRAEDRFEKLPEMIKMILMFIGFIVCSFITMIVCILFGVVFFGGWLLLRIIGGNSGFL